MGEIWVNQLQREKRRNSVIFLISCMSNSISHTIINTIWNYSNGVLFVQEEPAGLLTAVETPIYFLFEDLKFTIIFSVETSMHCRMKIKTKCEDGMVFYREKWLTNPDIRSLILSLQGKNALVLIGKLLPRIWRPLSRSYCEWWESLEKNNSIRSVCLGS